MGSNGVKVTYIETQFVTSDAESFKSLVQSLTGKDAVVGAAPARPLTRPQPRRGGIETVKSNGAAATGSPSYGMSSEGSVSTAAEDMRAAAPCLYKPQGYGLSDFSEQFYDGASERCQGSGYNDFLY